MSTSRGRIHGSFQCLFDSRTRLSATTSSFAVPLPPPAACPGLTNARMTLVSILLTLSNLFAGSAWLNAIDPTTRRPRHHRAP